MDRLAYDLRVWRLRNAQLPMPLIEPFGEVLQHLLLAQHHFVLQ
jgi:hypothetical protein